MCLMIGGIYAGYVVLLGYISNGQSKNKWFTMSIYLRCDSSSSPCHKESSSPRAHQLFEQCLPDLHSLLISWYVIIQRSRITRTKRSSQIPRGLGTQPLFRSTLPCRQWQFALLLSFALFSDVWINSWTRKRGQISMLTAWNTRKKMKSMDFQDKQLHKDLGSCCKRIPRMFKAHDFTGRCHILLLYDNIFDLQRRLLMVAYCW